MSNNSLEKFTKLCPNCSPSCTEHSTDEYKEQILGFNTLREFPEIPLDLCALMMDFASAPPIYSIKEIEDKIIETMRRNNNKNGLDKSIHLEIYQYMADNHALFIMQNKQYANDGIVKLDEIEKRYKETNISTWWIPRIRERLKLDIEYLNMIKTKLS